MSRITVRIVEARGLTAADACGKSDPFAELRIMNKTTDLLPTIGHLGKSNVCKTKVIRNTLSPIWNEEFTFDVRSPMTDMLEVKVLDWDRFSTNDTLGVVMVPIGQVLQMGRVDAWYNLTEPLINLSGRKARGSVHLIISVYGMGMTPP